MGAQNRESSRPAPSRSRGPSVQCCSILPTIGAGRGARAGRMVVRREEGGEEVQDDGDMGGKGGRGARQGGDGTG
jgi:hypothetical protein